MATTPKVSKVKNVQSSGSFFSKAGNCQMYSFDYEFEDGAMLSANHKTEHPSFGIGSEVEYQIKETNQYGNKGTVGKVKAPHVGGQPFTSPTQTNQQGAFLKSPDVQDMIIRQSSVKAAIDFKVASGSNVSLSEVLSTAETIYQYCKNGTILPKENNNPF